MKELRPCHRWSPPIKQLPCSESLETRCVEANSLRVTSESLWQKRILQHSAYQDTVRPRRPTGRPVVRTSGPRSQEGEAIALLSIAECRLEAPNRPEALGAAQRARQLFREERHRRGRLQALELMARAWQETLPALEERESR